jgi:dTDP-glucose 4,6-dehydratase
MSPPQHTPRVVLVTGGAGFIGSNYIRYLLESDPAVRVVNVDALTYAGNLDSLTDVAARYGARYRFLRADIADSAAIDALFAEHAPDTVVHFAAESHVDRSIDGPMAFVRANVLGTAVLLEAARQSWRGRSDVRFHHISTDEVFGSLGETGYFSETTAYDPSSPYSASKAGADHLVRAWYRTFGLPVTVSNCSNNYGPWQFPEKLIPLMILKALRGDSLPVYGDGQNVRDWLYVEDHAEAIDRIVRFARTGSTYVISGQNEWTNLDIVHTICDRLDQLRPAADARRALVRFVTDRPGHDRRYAIDATRLREDLGWSPRFDFSNGLERTIAWYLENTEWLDRIASGQYRGERLGAAV